MVASLLSTSGDCGKANVRIWTGFGAKEENWIVGFLAHSYPFSVVSWKDPGSWRSHSGTCDVGWGTVSLGFPIHQTKQTQHLIWWMESPVDDFTPSFKQWSETLASCRLSLGGGWGSSGEMEWGDNKCKRMKKRITLNQQTPFSGIKGRTQPNLTI